MRSKDQWMSIKEISLMYNIPLRTLQDWCQDGTIPPDFAQLRGNFNSWHVNVGKLRELSEIRYHIEEESRPLNSEESTRTYDRARRSRNGK